MRAIITRGLYTFYPLSEVHLCTVTFGYYSRAVSNQEQVIVAPVRYLIKLRGIKDYGSFRTPLNPILKL